MSEWKEAQDATGRVYYYNSKGETTWSKPKETPVELEPRLEECGWKVATTEDGSVYYYNRETGESRWEKPELEPADEAPREEDERTQQEEKNEEPAADEPGVRIELLLNSNQKYHNQSRVLNVTVEKDMQAAERLFLQMLKDHQVDSTWSFNRIISELSCQDPRYWCVDDDPLWKQTTFEKYLTTRTEDQLLKEHTAVSKFKDAFLAMLRERNDIHYYTRWPTVRRLIANEPIYKHSVMSEKVKRETFQEYVSQLAEEHKKNYNKTRTAALEELRQYLRSIITDRNSLLTWAELEKQYLFTNARFVANKHFETLEKVDILREYIEIVTKIISDYDAEIDVLSRANYTKDRIARDAFKELLREHKASIRYNTSWNSIYQLIKNDPRFLNTLGRSGSSALDLFLDQVEEHRLTISAHRSVAQQILIDENFQWNDEQPPADREKILAIIREKDRFKNMDSNDLDLIAEELIKTRQKKLQDDQLRLAQLKEQRKQYFALLLLRVFRQRDAMPAWEEARERIKHYPEFQTMAAEESVMQEVYEQFCREGPALPLNTAGLPPSRKRPLASTVELDY
ncbi:AaceriADR159Cp [[Ashbya] aceris (nom. inval.)]|nr:AaceriADR159Cp [[Ashbya] aceris (nom. inval.)]